MIDYRFGVLTGYIHSSHGNVTLFQRPGWVFPEDVFSLVRVVISGYIHPRSGTRTFRRRGRERKGKEGRQDGKKRKKKGDVSPTHVFY